MSFGGISERRSKFRIQKKNKEKSVLNDSKAGKKEGINNKTIIHKNRKKNYWGQQSQLEKF